MKDQPCVQPESGGNRSISDLGEHRRFGDREASEWASAAAPAAADALPCLLSNNSDEPRVKVCGVDRKRAETTRQNIAHFQRTHGNATGLLTITFAEDLTTKEAQRKLGNFKRRVLKENFGDSITVREFTQRGRPHFHIIIDCRGDIATGYNWAHHERVTAWSKAGRKGAKPHGSLNRTPLLKKLHGILAEKATLYGLGQIIELVPIKKPDAIGFYLAGYLVKSLDHKPADAKGTRAVNYSHKCPRILSGRWSWANAAGWVWRAKLGTWARKHGCATMKEVAALFGSKWAYHHREAILATELSYYPTSEHARIDGVSVPDDVIDIRITRTRSSEDEGRDPMADLKFEPAPCITAAHREEAQRLAVAWIERCSWESCDSSQANGAESSHSAERMFPPEERSEEKRGSPLVFPPVGDSTEAAPRQKRVYVLQSRAARDERANLERHHYQRPLRLKS